MKTRYAIIEPGPLRVEDLYSLTWVDVELETAKQNPERRVPRFDPRDDVLLSELHRVLDPLFPGSGFEYVHVNSIKGPASMFVGEMSAREGKIVKNDGATLIYWTATILHKLAADDTANGIDLNYAEMQKRAVLIAGQALNGTGMMAEMRATTPRIYGRAVLFDDEVWK